MHTATITLPNGENIFKATGEDATEIFIMFLESYEFHRERHYGFTGKFITRNIDTGEMEEIIFSHTTH